jgi:transmembrane sensor
MSSIARLRNEQSSTGSEQIIKQAAVWLSRINEGPLSNSEREALSEWRSLSDQHEFIWQRAGQLSSKLKGIPSKVGLSVLDRPASQDRRAFIKSVAAMVVAVPTGFLVYRYLPWQVWSADYSTYVGSKQTIQLADDSQLILNTDSAADVSFDESKRLITLHQGEIFIETAKDSLHRPLFVETLHGRLQALGTKFVVRKDTDYSYLGVLEGAVDITPRSSEAKHMIVNAGSQSKFTATAIMSASKLDDSAFAWINGILYADNMRLADFVATLSRYRSGILRCDSSAADIRISGAFQLNDIDKILEVVVQTRPVKIDWRTRYWGTIYKTSK